MKIIGDSMWNWRFALNVVLTVIILMPLGYHRMWSGWGGGILFFAMIIAINFGVRAVGFGMDARTANQNKADWLRCPRCGGKTRTML